MGNCQAAETAKVVIQHPNGKEEKLGYQVSANFVMKMNPGHCVSLLISTTALSTTTTALSTTTTTTSSGHGGPLRVTRIKLLRPTEMLAFGNVYRLVTTKEVMKGLMAKKCSKLKKEGHISEDTLEMVKEISYKLDMEDKMKKQEKERSRISRSWQPSLQSISEGGSSCSISETMGDI